MRRGLAASRRGLLAAALATGALPLLAQTQSAPEIDVPAYVATLDALAAEARATTADAIPAFVARLPEAWTVRVGSERVRVASSPIAAGLPASGNSRDEIVARLEGMRAEVSRLSGAGPAPPPHVRTALAEILAAPEFRGRERYAALLKLFDRLRTWVRSWFPSLSKSGEAVAPAVKWLSWIVAGVAFVLLAGLVWRLLRGATAAALVRVRPTAAADAAAGDARSWTARARAAVAAGDAREAVRCAYHAVLHRLDEDGAWTLEEARTPREYLRLLPAADRRRPAVSFVARLFEGTWYGGAEPGVADAQAALARLGELGCDAHADPAI